jgi:hypothetical protein
MIDGRHRSRCFHWAALRELEKFNDNARSETMEHRSWNGRFIFISVPRWIEGVLSLK